MQINKNQEWSSEQRLKERGRQKIAGRKRLQLRLWIRVASIIINIKTLKSSIPVHRCFTLKKKNVSCRFLFIKKTA
jgi:hypothetical protein